MNLIYRIWNRVSNDIYALTFPHVHKSVHIHRDAVVYNHANLIMEENTVLSGGTTIMNTRAKFIVKRNSGAAFGLAVVTGNHMVVPGMWLKDVTDHVKDELDRNHEYDKDVVIEEDVWVGARAVLLSGVTVGRGSIVGAGSVVRSNVPPYAIVAGNPAKIVGFKFTPNVIVEHEELLYPEKERIPLDVLQANYQKYFLSRINDIRKIVQM